MSLAFADYDPNEARDPQGKWTGQTATPEFKAWFGASKVVDESGKPKIVYHGTGTTDILSFEAGEELGAHFGTERQANEVAESRPYSSQIYPVFLQIEHLLRLRDTGSFSADAVAPQLEDLGIIGAGKSEHFLNLWVKDAGAASKKLRVAIKKAGYDGVVYLNRREGTGEQGVIGEDKMSDAEFRKAAPHAEDSYIVFEPTQVKSAIGNKGTFSKKSTRITDASPDQEDVREGLEREVTRRWTHTAREVRRAILLHDALGIGDKAPRLAMPTSDKAEMFRRWLNERLAIGVGGYDGSWVEPFVRRASDRGAVVGFQDAVQANLGFMTPGAAPSAKACHGATVASLAGICEDVSQRAHDSVAAGLLLAQRPAQIARLVDQAMGHGLKRSRALAEHSVTQAYSQATLDAMEARGVTHVGTVSERKRRLRDAGPEDEPRDEAGRWTSGGSSALPNSIDEIDPNKKVALFTLYRGTGVQQAGNLNVMEGDLGRGVYLTMNKGLAASYGGGPKASVKAGTRVVSGYSHAPLFPDEVAYVFGGLGKADPVRLASGTGIEFWAGEWDGGRNIEKALAEHGPFKLVIGTPNSIGINQIAVRDPSILNRSLADFDPGEPALHDEGAEDDEVIVEGQNGAWFRVVKNARGEYDVYAIDFDPDEPRNEHGEWAETSGLSRAQSSIHHGGNIAEIKALARNSSDHSVRFLIRKDGSVSAADAALYNHAHMEPVFDRWAVSGNLHWSPGSGFSYFAYHATGKGDSFKMEEGASPAEHPFLARLERAGIKSEDVELGDSDPNEPRDALALADWFEDAARKTPQPKHPRTGQFAKAHVVAREMRRSKRTGQFRRQGLSPEEQRLEELTEARFGRVTGRFDVLTAGDDRVCDVCDEISANGPYTINKARGLIPAHPNCRCVFVAAGTMRDALADFDPGEPRNEKGEWTSSGGIEVYHGTPHDFTQFDLHKIGTGEGAQAYGYGLYFAESKTVARNYQNALAKTTPGFSTFRGRKLTPAYIRELSNDPDKDVAEFFTNRGDSHMPALTGPLAKQAIEGRITSAREQAEGYRRRATELRKGKAEGSIIVSTYTPEQMEENAAGHEARLAKLTKVLSGYQSVERQKHSNLYTVRIHAEPDDFIDWDVPFNLQSAKVREVFGGVGGDLRMSELADLGNPATTKQLSEKGISGIRYLDAGSRHRPGEYGSHNYVVFDPSILEITHKNSVPLTRKEAHDALMDMLADYDPAEPRDPQGKWTDEGIVAYHGSAADFAKFDLGHIGQGEGSLPGHGGYVADYGYGLYFAGDRAGAQTYQESTSPRRSWSDPVGGHMYQVRIHAKPEEFIDWDKPLTEQSATVKAGLGRIDWASATRRQFKGAQVVPHTAQGAAEMSAAGIKGVRYLDQQARLNYVVFDPGVLEITHKNGVPLTKAEARDALFDMLADFDPGEPRDPQGRWTLAYHGTRREGLEQFSKLSEPDENFNSPSELGFHFAKDPEISNAFTEMRYNAGQRQMLPGGHIIPVKLPPDEKFLPVPQPPHPYVQPGDEITNRNIEGDDAAIRKMISLKAYPEHPDILASWLEMARAVPEDGSARLMADKLIKGQAVELPIDGSQTLHSLVENFSGAEPYDKEDKHTLVRTARKKWKAEGYAGLKYINTSPSETGEEYGVKDFTSYIVFDPKDVKGLYTGDRGYDPDEARDPAGRWTALAGSQGDPALVSTAPITATGRAGSEQATQLAASKSRYIRIDMALLDRDRVTKEKMVDLFRNAADFPMIRANEWTGDTDKDAKLIIDRMKSNLNVMWGDISKDEVKAWRGWYEGAHNLIGDRMKQYAAQKIDRPAMTAVYAAQSPNTEWDVNVHLGDRLLDTYFNHATHRFDAKMAKAARQQIKNTVEGLEKEEAAGKSKAKARQNLADMRRLFSEIKGKTLRELTDTEQEAAWVKLYNDAHDVEPLRTVNVDGSFGDIRRKKRTPAQARRGEQAEAMVGAFGTLDRIGNAINALRSHGDANVISEAVGDKHKVRSFYNNMLDPNSPNDDTTIDTHAGGAAWLFPFGAKDKQVKQLMGGGGGEPGSSVTGIKGSYPFYADAYRGFAHETGVLNHGREAQSVLWMKKIQLFRNIPDARKEAVWRAWQDYHDGRAELAATQHHILRIVKGQE